MPNPVMPGLTLYKTATEPKTFGADFQLFGPVKEGEVISNPQVIISAGHGCVIEGVAILVAIFIDAADGKSIPIGKGFKFRLRNGNPGKYTITLKVDAAGGDSPEIVGKLVITSP